ncbi:MAG: alpha/beta fold hydrolase [Microcoleaceae cyanobacterium]
MSTHPRNPVLLIHGIFDTNNIFNRMSAYLTRQGWEVHSFNLQPRGGFLELERLAQQITDYVEKTFPPDQPFDLLGFSMGGIVSRYYIQRLGGIDRVQRFITISSPHNGTWTSYFYITPGTVQMRPDSHFLKDLNQDIDQLNQLNFTSIWTPFDGMIVPANSSQLPVGEEIKLDILLHAWMVRDRRCLHTVANVLSQPIKSSVKP